VTLVCVGSEAAKESMRTALAMGADSGVLVKDAVRADAFQVATNLAAALREISPDIVFCGRQSVDYDGAQIGPMIAELLGWPCASTISKIDANGNTLTCERDVEGGKELLTISLPCVVTAQKGLNDPRYPSLPNIMKAKSKPIREIDSDASVAPRTEVIAMRKPATKRLNKIVGTGPDAAGDLVRLLHEEAKVI
jgi:electron transfer flavoprotein beta subunit